MKNRTIQSKDVIRHIESTKDILDPILEGTGLVGRFLAGKDVYENYSSIKSDEWNTFVGRIGNPKAGVLYELFPEGQPERAIKMYNWIRPVKKLVYYPVFNYTSDIRSKEQAYKMLSENNIHFNILLLRMGRPSLFWVDSYDSIGIEHWKETYRNKKERMDRIYLGSSEQKRKWGTVGKGYEKYKYRLLELFN
jgi:hypothetical protein